MVNGTGDATGATVADASTPAGDRTGPLGEAAGAQADARTAASTTSPEPLTPRSIVRPRLDGVVSVLERYFAYSTARVSRMTVILT